MGSDSGSSSMVKGEAPGSAVSEKSRLVHPEDSREVGADWAFSALPGGVRGVLELTVVGTEQVKSLSSLALADRAGLSSL